MVAAKMRVCCALRVRGVVLTWRECWGEPGLPVGMECVVWKLPRRRARWWWAWTWRTEVVDRGSRGDEK